MYSIEKLKQDRMAEFYDVPFYDALNYYNNIEILGVYHDIDEKLIVKRDKIITLSKIRYNLHNKGYIISNGRRYFLENFMPT